MWVIQELSVHVTSFSGARETPLWTMQTLSVNHFTLRLFFYSGIYGAARRRCEEEVLHDGNEPLGSSHAKLCSKFSAARFAILSYFLPQASCQLAILGAAT